MASQLRFATEAETESMRWLITGGNGFLGLSAAEYLVRQAGNSVVGLTRQSGLPDWFQRLEYPSSIESLTEIIRAQHPDCIFHAAGAASVGDSWEAPARDFVDSVVTWHAILEATRRSGLKPKLFFPSSAAVFGDPDRLPIPEEAARRPISPYGFHKLVCEQLAEEYAVLWEMPVVICRLFSVFGPRQRRLLVWELVEHILSNRPRIRLQGTGLEERDYLAASDIAKALDSLAHQPSSNSLQIFNFGSGVSSRVVDLIEILKRLTQVQKPVVRGQSGRHGDPMRWRADNRRLRETLPDWRPQPIEQGLAECLAAWKADTF
jgi:UDP-glucose 4-epimerase